MGMAKADVLDRVDADLAQGYTAPAIQRLSSLVAAHPTDLDLRQRLAAAHRQVGNLVEAGRWSYLSPAADPRETTAFERAYPVPARRLRALRWPEQGYAATDFARTRLTGLSAAPALRPSRRRLAAWVALAVALPFAVLGLVTIAQWLVG
jgi:hypothetical protein